MRRIIIGFLALTGLTTIVLSIATPVIRSSVKSDIAIVKSLPSPDSKFTATVYSAMGGGAVGWCSFFVSINTTTSPFSLAAEQNLEATQVYKGRCSITPQVRWVTPKSVQIALLNFNQSEWISAELKGLDQSGQVSVSYLFTPTSVLK